MLMQIPLPKIVRAVPAAKESKYTLIFSNLKAGTDECHVETGFIDAKKMANRMNGAVAAYRGRTGDKSAFAVRIVEIDGKDAVAVWKLDKEFTPRQGSKA